jgi:hypothetical protein
MGSYYSKYNYIKLDENKHSIDINTLNKNNYPNIIIKSEKDSYEQQIIKLEEEFNKKIINIEKNSDFKINRTFDSINHLYDRIIIIENNMDDSIILKPLNNRPFIELKK